MKKIVLVFFALSLQLAAQGGVDLKENHLLHCEFDDNAEDTSGNMSHVSPIATLSVDRFGRAQKAYHFDGIDASLLEKGIYIVQLMDNQGNKFSYKKLK